MNYTHTSNPPKEKIIGGVRSGYQVRIQSVMAIIDEVSELKQRMHVNFID